MAARRCPSLVQKVGGNLNEIDTASGEPFRLRHGVESHPKLAIVSQTVTRKAEHQPEGSFVKSEVAFYPATHGFGLSVTGRLRRDCAGGRPTVERYRGLPGKWLGRRAMRGVGSSDIGQAERHPLNLLREPQGGAPPIRRQPTRQLDLVQWL